MKTIRLLYPDYAGGGLETYYFGAHLLQHILPPNDSHKLVQVAVAPPDGREKTVTGGIFAGDEVLGSLKDAQAKIAAENPDRIITIGGNCLVSLAPFDYLHGRYGNTGIIWIGAHPDVTTPEDGYPYAHAMVPAALLGRGARQLHGCLKNKPFDSDQIFYIGLQKMHAAQENFLQNAGVDYKIQDRSFVSREEISRFARRFDHILVHLDVDVLDEKFFRATYFANPELTGDGSGGGKMKMEQLAEILTFIDKETDIAGLTVAEYLPFEAQQIRQMFAALPLFRG